METIAPTGLAQSWDNVGLLAGDATATVGRVLACIDLTAAVVDEAIRKKSDLILAYHPPIFKPISSIRGDSSGTDAAVFRCIRNGIAVYAMHTALDAAEGGTNDVMASLCGIARTEPIEYVDQPRVDECKLVVFVPPDQVERVADAMFAAGAGHIGDYSRCSYRLAGQGTFFGDETTSPTVGQHGQMEYVDEIRLESVVPSKALPGVVTAMIKAHSYEEPAFDIYPLEARPVRGIGRIGYLPRPTTLTGLARKLKRATQAAGIQIVGPPDRKVERAVIVVGAAGTLPFRVPLSSTDVIITGEIRHHDALTIRRLDGTAIALGHWASERPVLPAVTKRLEEACPGIVTYVSSADRDVLESV
jgi:dinuclear metal center YbgI/SA1388 family protein